MDTRLYILAGAFIFLVLALGYLIAAWAAARRAARAPVPPPPVEWPMLRSAPPELEAAARADRTFAESTTGIAAVLSTPLRTGEWRPDAGDARLPRTSRVDDYWDSLIEEESLLVQPTPTRGSVAEVWPGLSEPDLETAEKPTPAPGPNSAPSVEPTPPVAAVASAPLEAPAAPCVSAPAVVEDTAIAEPARSSGEWIDELVAELEQESVAEVPAPAPAPPAPAPAPQPQPAPAPAPPAPAPAQPAPAPPAPAPAPQPAPPRPIVVVPPLPVPPAAPVQERPSALENVADRADAPRPAAVAHVEAPSASDIPEHELVAPVEMWFGDVRIGVKRGTKTYDRFQKIAQVLFDDLRNSSAAS